MSPSYQQNEPTPSLTSQQQTMQQFMMQQQADQQTQQQQQQQQQTPNTQVSSGNSPPDSPVPSTMMGQLMGALNNHPTILDDLNINIESLHSFDCDIDEVRAQCIIDACTMYLDKCQIDLLLWHARATACYIHTYGIYWRTRLMICRESREKNYYYIIVLLEFDDY